MTACRECGLQAQHRLCRECRLAQEHDHFVKRAEAMQEGDE